MGRLRVEISQNRVVFVYSSYIEAEEAFKRLRYLNPHICSQGGHLNAVSVDMRSMPTIGDA